MSDYTPTSRERDINAAVREAYTDEGRVIWWNSWLCSDEAQRARMEAGVLIEWSGVR